MQTKSKRILVIDDKMIITIIIKKILREVPEYEVYTITDSSKAFMEIDRLQPDVVISDINMPKVTGIEIAQQMKSKDKYSKIKLIIVSSDYRQEIIDKLDEIGVETFVKKPFQKDEFLQIIKNLFDMDEIIKNLFTKNCLLFTDVKDFEEKFELSFFRYHTYSTIKNFGTIYKMDPEEIGVMVINLKSKDFKLHNVLLSISRKKIFRNVPIIAVPNSHTNFTELSNCDFTKLKILQSSITATKLIKELPTIMRELWDKK